jgi:hypothetical protein
VDRYERADRVRPAFYRIGAGSLQSSLPPAHPQREFRIELVYTDCLAAPADAVRDGTDEWPGDVMGTKAWLLGYAVGMILVVIVTIVIVFRRASRMPPEEIIRRRYARGEIDREQYQQMLGDLTKHP